jgi:Holliday junction DNA helicase RuvB
MKMQFIDHLGLDKRDRRLMLTMRDGFNNRTVGLQSLASASNMNTKTIEEELEPWLVHCGLIERTARGRLLTGKGLNHLAKGE